MGGFAVGTVIMLTDKNDLLRSLNACKTFDKGSPYVSVQLPPNGGKPQFYRSSADGFIFTKGFNFELPVSFVSLEHLITCLKNVPEAAIELGLDANGIMRILGTSSDILESEAHVLTVSARQAGGFTHNTGELVAPVEPHVFHGINVRPFGLSSPPVLAKGKLMLSTKFGATVIWTGPEALNNVPEIYPRDNFLRAIAGDISVEDLSISTNGYWMATNKDVVLYVKGHTAGRQQFDLYNTPIQEIAKLPAERFLVGLGAAVGLLEPTEMVEVDPRLGVLARGKFGDNRNSLGETGNWSRFTLLAQTANVIYDALSQAIDDEAVLYTSGSGTMRLKRGPFEVNFKTFNR
jgi:hypothetical protein